MVIKATVTMSSNIDRAGADVLAGILHGETLAAQRLLALSAEQVPHDIGTLEASGTVEPARTVEEGSAVIYHTPYAARLHEHPEYKFQGGRKGKYVEDPAVEHRGELGDIIRKAARGD